MTTTPDPHAALKAKLLPCPFCGAGETEIRPNGQQWLGMRYSEPASVSVRHWCAKVEGQPSRLLERVGKDEPSAIAAWNLRSREQAPAPEDSMMLDWLETQDLNDIAVIRQTNDIVGINVGHGPRYGRTLREAIRAAMGADKGEPRG